MEPHNQKAEKGAATFGTGNVVIAPNILEEMANDPEKCLTDSTIFPSGI